MWAPPPWGNIDPHLVYQAVESLKPAHMSTMFNGWVLYSWLNLTAVYASAEKEQVIVVIAIDEFVDEFVW